MQEEMVFNRRWTITGGVEEAEGGKRGEGYEFGLRGRFDGMQENIER